MSSIITFFVAPDNAAAAGVADSGPEETFPSARYGNFDVFSTLDEWESLLTGRDLDEIMAGGGADVVNDTDIPLVLLVPAGVTEALAHADAETLSRTTDRWTGLRAEEGEVIDDALARELVSEVAALSAQAQRTRGSLYCWVC